MKRFLLSLSLVVYTLVSWGAKASSEPATIIQPDGLRLTITLHGDEYFNYATTTDGVLLYQDGNTFFIASVDSNGELSSTNVLAHNAGQRTEEEIALIGLQDKEKFYQAGSSAAKKSRRREPVSGNKLFPHTGSPNVLVALVDFADFKFKNSDEKTIATFDCYLNSEAIKSEYANMKENGDTTVCYNYGSVGQYFKDMSFGNFTPHFDVIPSVIHLQNNMKYYGEGKNDKIGNLIPEVGRALKSSVTDFSKYDSDNDGYIDLLYIIYAGYSQSVSGNSSDCIWPKVSTYTYNLGNGMSIYYFGVNGELLGNPQNTEMWKVKRINGIGLFCHEFSHAMGLPDLYPTTDSAQDGNHPGMEYWDLMDGGEYTYNGWNPTEYTAWERECMGWMTIDDLTAKGSYRLGNINKIDEETGEYGKAYRIKNDSNEKEYVILQNIRPNGWNTGLGIYLVRSYDPEARCKDMLAMHVDYDANKFSLSYNSVNNEDGHPRFTLIPADGRMMSSYAVYKAKDDSDAEVQKQRDSQKEYLLEHCGDTYPGSKGITQLTNIPWYATSADKPIYNIKEVEHGVITFDFLESTVGIEGILSTENETDSRIYTLDGILAGTDKNKLKKGIYIINKKKVIIR